MHSHWKIEETVPYQWNDCSVTTGPNVNFIGFEPVYSVADLNPSMPYPPEYGNFVIVDKNMTDEYTFSETDAEADLSTDLGNYHSFLNQEAMRAFYVAYEGEDFDTL